MKVDGFKTTVHWIITPYIARRASRIGPFAWMASSSVQNSLPFSYIFHLANGLYALTTSSKLTHREINAEHCIWRAGVGKTICGLTYYCRWLFVTQFVPRSALKGIEVGL